MDEHKNIKIRVTTPHSNKERVYEYRDHKILPISGDLLNRYELLVEVVEDSEDTLKKIFLFVHKQVGTEAEMKKLWASVYDNCSLSFTRGLEFS